MKRFGMRVVGAAVGAAAICGAASGARASGEALVCYDGAQEIFSSSVADIEEFDAQSFGVTFVKTLYQPADDVTLYFYEPGEVICAVEGDHTD